MPQNQEPARRPDAQSEYNQASAQTGIPIEKISNDPSLLQSHESSTTTSAQTTLRDGRSNYQRSRHDEVRQRRMQLKYMALMMVDEAIQNDAETFRLQRKLIRGATRADLTEIEWTRVHLRWVYIHKGKQSALFSARQTLLERERKHQGHEHQMARKIQIASWRDIWGNFVVKHEHSPGMIMCVMCSIRWSNFDEGQP